MLLWDTVEFAHMTLGLVPEIIDPVYVILAIREAFRMVDAKVVEVRHIQHIVAAPAV